MSIKIAVFLMSLAFISADVSAGQLKEVVLEDGTVLYGEVVSLNNGEYIIRTRSMGEIKIDEDKIESIKNKSEARGVTELDISKIEFKKASPTSPDAVKAGIDAIKRSLESNSAVMESINDLQNDPDFMAVIHDPEIMSAINSGNINVLTSYPKFLKLLEHPMVKDVSGKK